MDISAMSWDLSPQEAVNLQRELAGRVSFRPLPKRFDILAASDIAYAKEKNRLVAVIVTFRWPDLEPVEAVHVISPVRFPYIPGLLSFREVPALLEAYELLRLPPDVMLCDGQGIAHPRRLGLASHLGLCLAIPTVGCAKKRLCGIHGPLELRRGFDVPLVMNGEIVGCVLCSRDGVKPLFISPGHLSDLETSRELVRRCLGRFRIPEPLRQAHHLATRLREQLATRA